MQRCLVPAERTLHAARCRHSIEASLSIRALAFWSTQIHFDLVHGVPCAKKKTCVVWRQSECMCDVCFFYPCPSIRDPTQEIWKQLILVLVMVALMHRIDFNKKRMRKNISARSAPVNKFITDISNKTGFVKVQLPWQRTNTLKLGNTFLHRAVCTDTSLTLCSLVLTPEPAVCMQRQKTRTN